MKRILYTLIYTLVIALPSSSQTDSSSNALQFNFVNSTSLAYRYRLSSKSELRVCIDLSGSLSDQRRYDVPVYYYVGDSILYKYDEVNSVNNESIRFSTDYLYTFYTHEYVSLYFGAGPFASFTRNEYEYTREYSGVFSHANSKLFSWSVGAILGTGVQCRVYEFVSILGEYSAILGYGYEGSRPTSSPDVRVIEFRLEQVRIGICVRL